MKIVHVNASDAVGGAALAARRLHRALLELDVESSMLVGFQLNVDPTISLLMPDERWMQRTSRAIRRRQADRERQKYLIGRPSGAGVFSDGRGGYGSAFARHVPRDAVLALHWLGGLVDLGAFFRALPPRQQVVWVLSDMNAFTGGCHSDAGCGRYVAACGWCPQLGRPGEKDLSRDVWQRKLAAFRRLGNRLHVVAPSTMLADQVRASSLLGVTPVTVIPPGVDTGLYKPFEKALARQVLGVPEGRAVVVVVAHSLDDPNKGVARLSDALASLPMQTLLLTVGAGGSWVGNGGSRMDLGRVGDERLLALVYNCADLVVVPSRQEAFGQVVLEALACGVPVAGFKTGGITDVVSQGINGFVVPDQSTEALRVVLGRSLADRPRLSLMAGACRESVAGSYSIRATAARFRELCESL